MKRTITVALLTEDTYAPAFIDGLIRRAINEGIITRNVVVCKSRNTYRKIQPCTDKMRRIVNTIIDMCDKILIFQDADGRDRKKVLEEVRSHLGELVKYINRRVFIIIFAQEIEEWIIPNTPSPADYLKRSEGYEKNLLPHYVNRVNFSRVRDLESFMDFLNALNDD
jgi:hypothetical protein